MHFVIDLETLGIRGVPVILSIAATTIEPSAVAHREWETIVDIQSCLDHGLTVDGDTIGWWLRQPDYARDALMAKPGDSLPDALEGLAHWLSMMESNPGNRFVWSHGATFDATILHEAYRIVHQKAPWPFRNVRDTRTLFHLANGMTYPASTQKHIAMEDVRWTRDAIIAANQYIAERNKE